ncbi:hypothetical protein [Prevotella sp. 10(H)]|uniref:hypothetical protein n=1 Tax=Prevotella sp. 10(H) TaxID=1158294 RepID=UPI0004A6DF82|nr:hypothetical protein [Prevotella sp. 10(H)]
MKELDIGRVSAYRRLNGEIPFTFNEIIQLARTLKFSIDDELFLDPKSKCIIDHGDYYTDKSEVIIIKNLQRFLDYVPADNKVDKRCIIIVANYLWFLYTLHFDYLFKFYYFKITQQNDISSLKKRMGDVMISESLNKLRMEVNFTKNMTNTERTFIFDRYIYFNTLSDIQYYYRRGLINDEELELIICDFKKLLYYIEGEVIEKKFNGEKNHYYISQKNIYTNTASVKRDDKLYCFFYQTPIIPLTCYNDQMCHFHRDYLESFKKQSYFISGSCEDVQIQFFEDQYAYIQGVMGNKDLLKY